MYNNSNNAFYKKKVYFKARHKWKEVREEYDWTKNLESEINTEFNKILLSKIKKNGLNNPLKLKKENNKNKTHKKEMFEDEDIKKVFRQAAKACHPDVAQKENVEIFNKIIESKKEGNIGDFLEAAKQLKIPNTEISIMQIEAIEQETVEMIEEINEITSTVQWRWWHENKKNKNIIMNNIIQNIKNEQIKKQ